MLKTLKVNKPTKEKIEAWLKDELNIDERNEIILGLLQHKDNETLQNLDMALFPEKYKVNETLFEWFNGISSKLADGICKLGEKISICLNLAENDLRPQMLGAEKAGCENILSINTGDNIHNNLVKVHRLKLKANSDFEFTIKLGNGDYIVNLMFANSNNESGFIFPDLLKCEIDPKMSGPQSHFSILKKGSYHIEPNESTTFIYTQAKYSKEKADYFKKCIQLGEQLGMVRWLKHIEADVNQEFTVAKIEITSES